MSLKFLSVSNAIVWLVVGVAVYKVHSSRVISSDGEIGIADEEAKDDPQEGLGVVIRPEGEIEPVAEAGSSESPQSQPREQEDVDMSNSHVHDRATATSRAHSENSSGVSGHLEEALIELTTLVNDTIESPESPNSVVSSAPGLSPDDATQRLAQRLGIPTVNNCLRTEGSYMGCTAGCRCGWAQQCYPKYVYIDIMHSSGNLADTRVNVGICETAMLMLMFISIALFFAALASVFACRLYFEWREKISFGVEEVPPRSDKGASGSGSVARRHSANVRANTKQDKGVRAGSKWRDADDATAVSGSEASGSGGTPDNART